MLQFRLQSQSQYPDVAFAEARVEEAAARAAETEYLAFEARARALEQQHGYWMQPAPTYYPPQYPVHPSQFGYAHYAHPGASRVNFSRDLSQQRAGATFYPQRSVVAKELEARLKEERLARLRAEHKLKELEREERERRLAEAIFVNVGARTKQSEAPKPKAQIDDYTRLLQLLGISGTPCQRPGERWTAAPRRFTKTSYGGVKWVTAESLLDGHVQVKPEKVQLTQKKREDASNPKQIPPKPAREGSLISQLKARYEVEREKEVRDTIQGITNSLSDETARVDGGVVNSNLSCRGSAPSQDLADSIWETINALSSPSKPIPNHRTTASPPSSSSTISNKGKEKEINVLSQSMSRDVVNALERVESIEHAFKKLQDEFVYPSQLDFVAVSSSNLLSTSGGLPHLAFTARNHPVRFYEQVLSSLLTRLDLIESHGNAILRHKRKDAVDSIERTLEDLEREIVGRWKARVAADERNEEGRGNVVLSQSTEGTGSANEDTVSEPAPTSAVENNLSQGIEEGVASNSSVDFTPVLEETYVAEEHDKVKELELEGYEVTDDSASALESAGPTTEQLLVPELPASTVVEEPEPRTTTQGAAFTLDESKADSDSEEDTFLLAQRDPPSSKPNGQHTGSSAEDLGSDWSDLDA